MIEKIYNGSLQPDVYINPQDPEYRKLTKETSNLMEECQKRFSEKDFKFIEGIIDLYGKSYSMHSTASFIYGFKIGALMMIEVLNVKPET
ncbi:hypothetical protein EIM92_15110 [Paenibacillus lentus]|uniref:Uncharacterized protein n=2 Tax=Paenibacillus lentus TaxID=1338368 RepID=A0A3S8RX95_9BACL|nr:hypothetical protein EIM92_15110 [Paenibacillus lentus]